MSGVAREPAWAPVGSVAQRPPSASSTLRPSGSSALGQREGVRRGPKEGHLSAASVGDEDCEEGLESPCPMDSTRLGKWWTGPGWDEAVTA